MSRFITISPAAVSLLLAACQFDAAPTDPRRPKDPDAASGPKARPAVLATLACGQLLETDVTLDNDLICSGDALTVNADGIRVNLNGHTIRGDGTGNGITVRGRIDVTIHGGTIGGFLSGIFAATSSGVVIKDMGFTENREAVFLNGTKGSTVKANVAWQNTLRGIMLRPTLSGVTSTDNVVVDNILTDNPSGILVFGQSDNTLKGNAISGSTVAAVDLAGGGATGNVVKGNLLGTSAAGIKFGPGWGAGNSVIGNSIQSNTCGLQGATGTNTFKDNVFSANGSDACP